MTQAHNESLIPPTWQRRLVATFALFIQTTIFIMSSHAFDVPSELQSVGLITFLLFLTSCINLAVCYRQFAGITGGATKILLIITTGIAVILFVCTLPTERSYDKLFNIPLGEKFTQENIHKWSSVLEEEGYHIVIVSSEESEDGTAHELRVKPIELPTSPIGLSIAQRNKYQMLSIDTDNNDIIHKITWLKIDIDDINLNLLAKGMIQTVGRDRFGVKSDKYFDGKHILHIEPSDKAYASISLYVPKAVKIHFDPKGGPDSIRARDSINKIFEK